MGGGRQVPAIRKQRRPEAVAAVLEHLVRYCFERVDASFRAQRMIAVSHKMGDDEATRDANEKYVPFVQCEPEKCTFGVPAVANPRSRFVTW
jgi:hypothetical protein